MPPHVASILFGLGIAGLFILDRDRNDKPSRALWIPVTWFFLGASRPISSWLTDTGIWNVGWVPSSSDYTEGSPIDRFVLSQRKTRVVRIIRSNLPILFFFAYCGMSLAWSDYPGIGFKRWIKFVSDLVMVLIVLTERNPSQAIKKFFSREAFLLIPLSILFIRYYPYLGRVYTRWEGELLTTGVTTDKNTLGMVCMIMALASLWRLLSVWRKEETTRRGSLIAHAVVLSMALWLLYRANSDTSSICFVMMAALMVATSRPKFIRRRATLNFLVIGMILACVCGLFVTPDVLALVGRNPTLTGRTQIWQHVLSVDSSPMFGVGFESFWLGPRLAKVWSMFPGDGRFHPNESHNGYIEIYLDLGCVGLISLIIAILSSYLKISRTALMDRGLSILRLVICVGAVAYNFTEAAFKELHPLWICFLWAAMADPKVINKAANASCTQPVPQPPFESSIKEAAYQPLAEASLRVGH